MGLNMKKGDYLSAILRSKRTVFTSKDLALLWGEPSSDATKTRIAYYVNMGKLFRIRKGIYAKDSDYDPLELATKIFIPSYVSFETVLAKEGVIFQHYQEIFVASYLTREIECHSQLFSFRKIKDTILTNGFGIINNNQYSIASPERAFLDLMYINKDYHFDNMISLNWDLLTEWVSYYQNKRMEQQLNQYYKKRKDYAD